VASILVVRSFVGVDGRARATKDVAE